MGETTEALRFYQDWYKRKTEAGDWHPDLNEQDSNAFAEMLDAYADTRVKIALQGCGYRVSDSDSDTFMDKPEGFTTLRNRRKGKR